MPTGKIKMYNAEGGYGFIRLDNPGENDLFFHRTQWLSENVPQRWDRVQFDVDVRPDKKGKHIGKTMAYRVKPLIEFTEADRAEAAE